MSGQEELDIISQIRGEVMAKQDMTGENLFLAWGYPTCIMGTVLLIYKKYYVYQKNRILC